MKTIAEIQRDAADLLERVGWTQNVYVAYKDEQAVGYCMLGACRKASGMYTEAGGMCLDEEEYFRARDRAYETALEALNGVSSDVAAWNDAPSRTKEEVVRALRDAAGDLP